MLFTVIIITHALNLLSFFYSAYCGGMWLAALKMFTEMAKILGHQADSNKFNGILEKAKVSFVDKLWNGAFDYVSHTAI